jgi:hypothetical protein
MDYEHLKFMKTDIEQEPLCSAAFAEWCKVRGVWPRLTHEEIWHTAWNAAIKAAEEIGYAIRTLMSPNTQPQPTPL